jgi:two-component sensor histidine kinase
VLRLANLDVIELARPLPPLATKILFGLGCAGFAVLLRAVIDIYLPGSGPFATTVPVVLVATLFGRWLSGAICQTLAGLHAWYYVLPIAGSFAFETASDAPRVLVNLAAGYFSVALAEIFRRTARNALRDREMLLVELEHRVKNSFASIASVIRLQLRDAGPEAREVLQTALGRVESFARAYGYLRFQFNKAGTIALGAYLKDLCDALEQTATHDGRIRFDCRTDATSVPRDKAITIGLLVNEIATNSVKHAFEDRAGVVTVAFETRGNKQILTIADDGPGMEADDNFTGLGRRLIDALAQQAGGTVELDSGASGTAYTVTFPAA